MKVYEIVDMIAKTLGPIAESVRRVDVYCLHFNSVCLSITSYSFDLIRHVLNR